MRLPRGTDAIIDLAKLREYVLNNTKHACLLLPCRSIRPMPNSFGNSWRKLLRTGMPYLGSATSTDRDTSSISTVCEGRIEQPCAADGSFWQVKNFLG